MSIKKEDKRKEHLCDSCIFNEGCIPDKSFMFYDKKEDMITNCERYEEDD